jgi:hypothetical protein
LETRTAVARRDAPAAAAPQAARGGADALADPLQQQGLSDPLQSWGAGPVQSTEDPAAKPETTPKAEGKEETKRGKEGTAEGKASYEATLGKFLGSKLYKLIAPHLTLDKMSGYADDGLTAGLTGLADQLKGLEGEVDPKAVEKFSKALEAQFGEVAGEWLKGDGAGFAEKVAGWVDTHPGTIVTIALLAAAGAIAADMDIPALKQKFGITDNLSAELEAKLGSLRDISLQSIEGTLAWKSKGIEASVTSGYDDEKGTHTHGAETKLSGDQDTFTFKGQGEFKGNDLELWSVDAKYQHFVKGLSDRGDSKDGFSVGGGYSKTEDKGRIGTGAISFTDGNTVTTHSGNYNVDTGVITLTNAYKLMLDSGVLEMSQSSGNDGSESTKLGYEGSFSDRLKGSFSLEEIVKSQGAGSAYDLDKSQKFSMGLDYERDWLKTELDAVFDSGGDNTLSGKADLDLGGNLVGGGQGTFRLNDPKLTEMGAYFGFRNPNEFTTFLGRYAYDSGKDSHKVSGLMELKLGEVYTRLEHSATFDPNGVSHESKAHAGYFFDDNKDVGLIGGATYRSEDNGFTPQLGMQIKGVPLMVGYDINNKAWTVGLTLPFGRK